MLDVFPLLTNRASALRPSKAWGRARPRQKQEAGVSAGGSLSQRKKKTFVSSQTRHRPSHPQNHAAGSPPDHWAPGSVSLWCRCERKEANPGGSESCVWAAKGRRRRRGKLRAPPFCRPSSSSSHARHCVSKGMVDRLSAPRPPIDPILVLCATDFFFVAFDLSHALHSLSHTHQPRRPVPRPGRARQRPCPHSR